jgi:hypothetical protein
MLGPVRTPIALSLTLLAWAGACGDDAGSPADAGPRDGDVRDGGEDDGGFDAAIDSPPPPDDAGSPVELPTCPVLAAFDLGAIDPPAEGSGGYEVPGDDVLDAAEEMVRAAAQGRFGTAAEAASRAGYTICRGVDAEDGLVLMQPLPPTRGWARVALRTGFARGVILEAPHPVHDVGTVQQSSQLFGALGARALVVSGTHRCASSTPGCSGSSDVCGPPDGFRESDAAHATNSIFQRAHVALATTFVGDVVISVHGMAGDGVSLSDGTTDPVDSDSPVARVAAGLVAAGIEGVTACNTGTDVTVEERLCGTTNVQGRHLNGSPDACTTNADSSSKRFLHLEQSLDVRMRPDDVAAALATALPS